MLYFSHSSSTSIRTRPTHDSNLNCPSMFLLHHYKKMLYCWAALWNIGRNFSHQYPVSVSLMFYLCSTNATAKRSCVMIVPCILKKILYSPQSNLHNKTKGENPQKCYVKSKTKSTWNICMNGWTVYMCGLLCYTHLVQHVFVMLVFYQSVSPPIVG